MFLHGPAQDSFEKHSQRQNGISITAILTKPITVSRLNDPAKV